MRRSLNELVSNLNANKSSVTIPIQTTITLDRFSIVTPFFQLDSLGHWINRCTDVSLWFNWRNCRSHARRRCQQIDAQNTSICYESHSRGDYTPCWTLSTRFSDEGRCQMCGRQHIPYSNSLNLRNSLSSIWSISSKFSAAELGFTPTTLRITCYKMNHSNSQFIQLSRKFHFVTYAPPLTSFNMFYFSS